MVRPHVDACSRSQITLWLASTLVLTAGFVAVAVPDLGHYPLVSGDDSWIMSASYQLATTGVFGSTLYAGFHGADEHYFIALPVYQYLQALSFTVFGPGISQARGVTVGSAVVVLWATTWLALRWHGLLAAVVSGLLLVGLRVNLVGLAPGLPLLAVGRTGRYDMTSVAFVWLTVVCFDVAIRRPPSRQSLPACLTGLCAGLATLSQFFGVLSILVVAAMLLWRGGQRLPIKHVGVRIAAGWAVVVLPYVIYVVLHWRDFRGQSALKAGRTDFHQPTFYLDNLRDEAARYAHLLDGDRIAGNGVGSWLFALAVVPVLGWLAWRSRQPGKAGDRLLLTTLLVCAIALALVDSTNVPLYAVVLWPGACIAIAAAVVSGLRWGIDQFHSGRNPYHRAVITLTTGALLVATLAIAVDGVEAYRGDRKRARAVSDYGEVAAQIDAALPAGAGIVGHERWWWGMHERDYLALNVLYQEWLRADDGDSGPSFAALVEATGAGALIIDDNARSEITRYPTALQAQIAAFLAESVVRTTVVTDPSYGRFEIYQLR